jgi:hypothetical protein
MAPPIDDEGKPLDDRDNNSNRQNNKRDDPCAFRSGGKPWPEDDDSSGSDSLPAQQQRHRSWHLGCSRVYRAYQRWTYGYMGPVLQRGGRQTGADRLTADDLYRVEAKYLADKFQLHYHHRPSSSSSSSSKNKSNAPEARSGSDDGGGGGSSSTGNATSLQTRQQEQQRRLMLTLWRIAAPTFVPAGLCELLTVMCQIALPLLVRELLRILEEHPDSRVVDQGLPCTWIDSCRCRCCCSDGATSPGEEEWGAFSPFCRSLRSLVSCMLWPHTRGICHLFV